MGYKADIQATRFTAATSVAVIAPNVRVKALSVASDGNGAGLVVLNTTYQEGGTNLLTVDVPTEDVYTLHLPEDGIVFPAGVYCSTLTNVTAVTLFTDKYSAPGLTTNNPG